MPTRIHCDNCEKIIPDTTQSALSISVRHKNNALLKEHYDKVSKTVDRFGDYECLAFCDNNCAAAWLTKQPTTITEYKAPTQ